KVHRGFSTSVYDVRRRSGLGEGGRDAGRFETEAVAEALRSHQFDTVLGRIGFDAKGDVTGYETFVWNVWKDGKYTPVEPGKLTE
ncbi:MAG: hypothetical protein ACREIR_21415, partial [Geminicoccaceae bacterium]